MMAGRLLLVVLMYSFHKIQAQDQPKPKLIVNSPVISETETVTLDCQTPSSVPVHQCFFYTVRRGNAKGFTCLQTLTGSELLMMSQKISPATVHVKCYYTVMHGDISTPSPHSDNSSITVQSQKPELSRQHFYREQVVFTCSLPASAHKDTRCNLYFGKASHPVTTTTVWKTRSSTNQWFCQFTVTIDDLLRRLRPLQRRDASCDYSLGSEPNSLSARSDRSSLNDIVIKESSMTSTKPGFTKIKDFPDSWSTASTFGITEKPVPDIVESTMTQTEPTSTVTTDQTVGSSITASFLSTSLTPVKPTSEIWIWTVIAVAACLGGVFLLGLTLLCTKGRFGKSSNKRSQAPVTGNVHMQSDDLMCIGNLEHGGSFPAGDEGTYSMITSVAAADRPTGSEKLKEQAPQHEDFATYHLYSTISEEPPPSALGVMVYSTLQPH
ncbi:uncharacterized protein [Cebidichthys violaceus]|uniref:uncharacterized protein isoform X2 n=1 Tax=Cebidichthys violaceus TaxID=271503 RepID=UPI0035CB1576